MVKEERKRRRSPDDYDRKRRRDIDFRRYKRESSPINRRSSRHHSSKHNVVKKENGFKTEIKTEVISQQMPLSNHNMVDELKQKEIMYQARMAIQERIQRLNLPTANNLSSATLKNVSVLKPEEASAFVDLQMQKLNRLNELKSRLSNKITPSLVKAPVVALDHLATQKEEEKLPKTQSPPFFDASSSASVLEVRSHAEQEPIIEYLDPRISIKGVHRPKRAAFNFKAQGVYQKIANEQRSKAKLELLQAEISQAAKQTGISSAVKLAIVTPSGTEAIDSHVPNLEWWDEIVLGADKTYDDIPSKDLNPQERYAETITELVEHPIQLKPPDEPSQPVYLKAYLTKKELRKLRRQNRREILKEKMEKVRLGLELLPEPKVKTSNLMKVLGNEAIQDPTKMEIYVRKQIDDRLKKHTLDNAERKLTPEQRAAKAARKIAEDTSLAVHVTIYKVKSLANPSKKFKVHVNAKQLQMTGIIILLDDINVIVVEGGPKQQKFYKNLILNRIKWSEEIAGEKKEISKTKNDQGVRNECVLIWEGIVQRRAFGEPKFVVANNHKHAREIFDKYGVPHYWDLCYSTTVLFSSEE